MVVKKVHYYGDVPAHVKRFSECLVDMPIDMVSSCILKYRDCYLVCRAGRSAESAWLGPWDHSGKWFVDLEC